VYRPDRNEQYAARSEPKRLRRRFHFHFRIKVGNDVLEGGDRLLNRGDLHQFPATDRAITILQGDNQIPPLFLKLDKRQTVVRQRSHHDVFQPLESERHGGIAGRFCIPLTKVAQILKIGPGRYLYGLGRRRLGNCFAQRFRDTKGAPVALMELVLAVSWIE